MLGWLFILIFGIFFFALGVLRMFYQLFFGSSNRSSRTQRPSYGGPRQGGTTYGHTNTSAGNAHHEGARANSRQRRSGKIFEKNEGQYVDFEEV